ncbi:hypothetical protein [Ornithinimicrobium cavernae]|uniref:hypothetical protein n=1 Tax=Ornithinimicrobium cavernae TaxID=2666047 RepID=UPI000D69D9D2|nr:hypothetical protein [Ornithinimicrobium cavernae]
MLTTDTDRPRPRHALLLSAAAAVVVSLAGLTTAPVTADTTAEATSEGTTAEETAPGATATAEDTTAATEPVVGEVTRLAGRVGPSGPGYSGDGGPATDALLNDRLQVAAAPDGTVYIADRGNRRLRAVDPDGTITTVARAMRSPENDIDLDVEGWSYSPSNTPLSADVADDGTLVVGANEDITRVSPDGGTTVLAGGGDGELPAPGESVPGESVAVSKAVDVAVAADGTVYAYLRGDARIIAVDPDGRVRVVAGGGDLQRNDADGTRPATDYAIGWPGTLAVADSGPYAGTLFFTAEQHARVMAVLPDGTLDVLAGTGEVGYSGDGGAAGGALLGDRLQGLAVTPGGDVLVGDATNAAIRRVDGDGRISTVRGFVGQVSSLDVLPGGDAVFTRGELVLRLSLTGRPATEVSGEAPTTADPFAAAAAGEVRHLAGADTEPAERPLAQQYFYPVQSGVAVQGDGAVVFGDPATATVRRVEADGTTSVLAGVWPRPDGAAEDTPTPDTVSADEYVLDGIQDLATTPDGTLLIAEPDRLWELHDDGTMTRVAGGGQTPAESFELIRGIATDREGTVYVADGVLVHRVAPDGSLETIAGGGERWADEADGHPATEASLSEPADVAVDSRGNVYLTESGMPHVRRIAPDGTLTTVLGDSYHGLDEGGFGGDGGPGAEAELNTPVGLLVGPDDELYVADTYNARVRRLAPDGTVTTVAGNGRLPDEQATGGPAVETPIGEPLSLALDPDGQLVIATTVPERVYRLTGEGALELVVETAPDDVPGGQGPATDAALLGLQDLALGPDGTPLVTGPAGTWAVGESVSRFGSFAGSRLTSGDAMYVSDGRTVSRVLPDGRDVLVAGGGPLREPREAVPALSLDLGTGVHDLAAGPDGSVYVLVHLEPHGGAAARKVLYRVTPEGLAEPVPLADTEQLVSIASGPDGTLYGLDLGTGQVLRLDAEGGATVVVGLDAKAGADLAEEPFGTATALPSGQPRDLAVGPEGHLFLVASEGVLVVDPAEDTYAFHDGLWTGPQSNVRVAADRHGNVYTLSHYGNGQLARVSALVRPAEVVPPGQLPWVGITAGAGGLALLGGAVLVWRLRQPR